MEGSCCLSEDPPAIRSCFKAVARRGYCWRSTSGGFDEYLPVVEILFDYLELAVQGIVIEEDEDQIMEEVHFFEDKD